MEFLSRNERTNERQRFPLVFVRRANSEMERVRRTNESEMEGVQAQLRYAQLRVQSLEQEMRSVKQELDQKVSDQHRSTGLQFRLGLSV